MKQLTLLLLGLILFSCTSDSDEPVKEVSLSLAFAHNWDGTSVTKDEFNKLDYTNKKGTKMSITKLRYLISRIKLTDSANNVIEFDGYKLVDLSDNATLSHRLTKLVKEGAYKLSCTFGFSNADNKDGVYQDLNSANWNVPSQLTGGYHYMQLEGKFKNASLVEQGYSYHAIKAYNPTTKVSKDTSFEIDLGTITLKGDATATINMNIAEWFKNPNEWDLETKNSGLMMNYDAQIQMSDNGKAGVFSLGGVQQ
jgi:hypothetical protein